jgi:hypothetical protein
MSATHNHVFVVSFDIITMPMMSYMNTQLRNLIPYNFEQLSQTIQWNRKVLKFSYKTVKTETENYTIAFPVIYCIEMWSYPKIHK